MSEIQKQNPQNQQENFKELLKKYLRNNTIEPEEAMDLLKKFDFTTREIVSFSSDQLVDLKAQFWEDFEAENFKKFLQDITKYHLDISKADKEALFSWVSDFVAFNEWEKYSMDLKNPKKPEWISEKRWEQAQKLLDLAKTLDIKDGSISFIPDWQVMLDLDITWSDLYIKLDWNDVIITWQSDWKMFSQKVLIKDFTNFVKNYDRNETRRVLEDIWFTGWMTLWWVLAFSFRTWIWLLLWAVWTWIWLYRWTQFLKKYSLSQNDAVSVFKENKDNPEVVKSYLFLSQVWYITWYDNWTFTTIDGEKISKDEVFLREKSFDDKDILKYQLLSWLKEKWFSPKFLGDWKYELDMIWLWDNSLINFEKNWKIKFSTSVFENWREFEFNDVKVAFEKIQKINQYLKLQSNIRNTNNSQDSFNSLFNDNNSDNIKLDKLKKEIWS